MKKVLGKKFGFLTVIKFHRRDGYSGKYWVCLCDCGTQKILRQDKLLSGKAISCGCHKQSKAKSQENKNKRRFYSYKARSRNSQIEFTLTKKEFNELMNAPCIYCGETGLTHTIDRIDSKQGYVEGNVAPACLMCNVAKNKYSQDVFLAWVRKIYEFNF